MKPTREQKCSVQNCEQQAAYQIGAYVPFVVCPRFYCEDHFPPQARKELERQEKARREANV